MGETVYPAICGSFKIHGEHSWREGFFWHRKIACLGSVRIPENFEPPSAALLPMKIIEHKHDFKLKESFQFGIKNDSDIAWECDWFDCNLIFVTSRDFFWGNRITYDIY